MRKTNINRDRTVFNTRVKVSPEKTVVGLDARYTLTYITYLCVLYSCVCTLECITSECVFYILLFEIRPCNIRAYCVQSNYRVPTRTRVSKNGFDSDSFARAWWTRFGTARGGVWRSRAFIHKDRRRRPWPVIWTGRAVNNYTSSLLCVRVCID
jgi:hypothetical protein